jgi:hypothetical protein
VRKQLLRLLRKPWRCAGCGYDLRGDGRNCNYCPQCGGLHSSDARLRRRRQLMLQLEQLQEEFVRNHFDHPA